MKKNLTAVFLFCIFAMAVHAVPGTEHFIKDNSGEYVYYEDFSFNRKSYVGFLTYDEGTFAVRYFAPATETLPYKNIELLFTIDTSKDYIDMTGERFLTPILQEDTEIVNYIHDLVYEFSVRRKRAGLISPEVEKDKTQNPDVQYVESSNFMDSGFFKTETFDQFGGKVCICYDYLVPVFNIKKIESSAGEPLFVAVASGILKSSDDRSFSDFKIIPSANNKKVHKAKIKKPKTAVFEVEKTKLTLDENWSKAGQLQNMFFYGDAAMLRVGIIDANDFYLYLKTALLSSSESFLPWDKISVVKEKNRITVYSTNYAGENDYRVVNSFMISNSLLDKTENALLSFSVSVADYESNRKYFSDVLKNWK